MITVRAADYRDSKDIFEWRNDELTRHMSHTTDFVQWDEHSRWFAASLTNKSRLLVICEEGETNSKIGIVRFDVDNERALISINLSPDMRGKGLAKKCLSEAIEFFKTFYPNVLYIDAEIKADNRGSKRSFESVGFVLATENGDVLYYQYSV
jgi:RimJ/RimL family protein N-acetyltransferase